MKTIINCICFLFLCSCSSELIDTPSETIERQIPQSRTDYNFSLSYPKFMVTDNYYLFTINGIGTSDFQSILWSLNEGNGSYVVGNGTSVTTAFKKGGWHSFHIVFYDFSYEHWGGDTWPFPVYQKAPLNIKGESVVDTEGYYTYSLDYPHNNTYTTEWEVNGNAQVQQSLNQISVHFPTAGTYTIKGRAIETCPQCDGGTYTSEWQTKEVEVLDHVVSDNWYIQNFNGSGRSVTFDLMYKATHTYRYFAMYIVYLYKGAYDGYYASSDWEWEERQNESYYMPPIIDPKYGFMTWECDYQEDESAVRVNAGEIHSYSKIATLPVGKTIDDIEYIILFIRDDTPAYRYSSAFDSVDLRGY